MNCKVYEHFSVVTHSAILLSTKLATELIILNFVFIIKALAVLRFKPELEVETMAGPKELAIRFKN